MEAELCCREPESRDNMNKVLLALLLLTVLCGFWGVYVKTQMTLIGYEIGEFKDRELKLRRDVSLFKASLVKLTKQTQLELEPPEL